MAAAHWPTRSVPVGIPMIVTDDVRVCRDSPAVLNLRYRWRRWKPPMPAPSLDTQMIKAILEHRLVRGESLARCAQALGVSKGVVSQVRDPDPRAGSGGTGRLLPGSADGDYR